jgi:hypothetical protein
MYMVAGYMPLHNLYLLLPTDVPDQVSHSRRHVTAQRRSPVFRNPHQVQMNLENRMRAASVLWHHTSLSRGARAEAVA